MANLLDLVDVDVVADSQSICHGVDLTIGHGQTHVLFGPNGCGKSSLLAAIMGLPPYRATGSIVLDGVEIGDATVDERARRGLALAYQRPPALRGVSLRALGEALDATGMLEAGAGRLDLTEFLDRDINTGFSGGEVKRWEILKLALQQPKMCLFDEPESGVDLEHIAAVGSAIERLLREPASDGTARSALIITHTGFILDYLHADVGHLMLDGRIVYSGDPGELFAHIQRSGYRVPERTGA